MERTIDVINSDSIRNFRLELTAEPVTVIVLVERGNVVLEINMEPVTVAERQCLLYVGARIARTLSLGDDAEVTLVTADVGLADAEAAGLADGRLRHLVALPATAVTDDEKWRTLMSIAVAINNLKTLTGVGLTFHPQRASCTMLVMAVFGALVESGNLLNPPYRMADYHYRRFVALVAERLHKHHEVAYYAAELDITRKHLNDICRQKSGMGAKDIVSALLMRRLKAEVTCTERTMKDIAQAYGFPDQSTMGKFFAKATGQSPLLYRKTMNINSK